MRLQQKLKFQEKGWELPRTAETERFFTEITLYRPKNCEKKG